MYIFTFYKTNDLNVKIHIGAMTLFEAVDALNALNNHASYIYKLNEYRLDELLLWEAHIIELCNILNVSEDYLEYPIFINNNQYKTLTDKIWFNGDINNFNHTQSAKIICKLDQIKHHQTNKGINTFLPTYDRKI